MEAFDVVVIGGGPAGSTIGRLLAQWGYSVLILSKSGNSRFSLAESLPPSCRKIFAFLDILPLLDAARFYRSGGNTVWWGSSEERAETFPGAPENRGYQVLRSDFDALLLDSAESSGARVCRNAAVRRVNLDTDCRATVEYGPAAGLGLPAVARFVVDCSGRAGVIARKGLRVKDARYATLAVVGAWKLADGWRLADPSHTLVETYADGWAWSVPISPRVRHFALMVDAGGGLSARPAGLESMYRAELGKTVHFRRLLSQAALQSAPWSRDASVYRARQYAGANFLLAGDAASFIDPLSSFGVKKAIASAWVGAVAVNTCLKRPEMRGAALEFFSAREQQVYESYLRQSARYFKEAAARHTGRFWRERARIEGDSGVWEADEEDLKRDPEVLAAFAAVKRWPSIRLERAHAVRIEKKPGIQGREIVLEDAVVSSGLPRGIRFVGGVNLPRLLEIAGDYSQVPDLFAAYNRLCPPVELPNFLGTLAVLLAKEILKQREVRP